MAVRAMYEYGGFWSLYVLRPGLGMIAKLQGAAQLLQAKHAAAAAAGDDDASVYPHAVQRFPIPMRTSIQLLNCLPAHKNMQMQLT